MDRNIGLNLKITMLKNRINLFNTHKCIYSLLYFKGINLMKIVIFIKQFIQNIFNTILNINQLKIIKFFLI